jgi:IS4 transposase
VIGRESTFPAQRLRSMRRTLARGGSERDVAYRKSRSKMMRIITTALKAKRLCKAMFK